VKPN